MKSLLYSAIILSFISITTQAAETTQAADESKQAAETTQAADESKQAAETTQAADESKQTATTASLKDKVLKTFNAAKLIQPPYKIKSDNGMLPINDQLFCEEDYLGYKSSGNMLGLTLSIKEGKEKKVLGHVGFSPTPPPIGYVELTDKVGVVANYRGILLAIIDEGKNTIQKVGDSITQEAFVEKENKTKITLDRTHTTELRDKPYRTSDGHLELVNHIFKFTKVTVENANNEKMAIALPNFANIRFYTLLPSTFRYADKEYLVIWGDYKTKTGNDSGLSIIVDITEW